MKTTRSFPCAALATIACLIALTTLCPALTVNGITEFNTNQTLTSLKIGPSGLARLTPGPGKFIDTQSLTISPCGVLDLAYCNVLVVRAPNAAVNAANLASITALIKSGLNNGANGLWRGRGITSSDAANDPNHIKAVGVLDNSQAGYTSFGGVAGLTGNEVIVCTTIFGDSDLNKVVNADDYVLINDGSNGGGSGWLFGDYNYDGMIDAKDYSLIDNSFNNGPGNSLTLFTNPVATNPCGCCDGWGNVSNTGPSAREHHAMAYDSGRDRTVLFGGDGAGYLGDTWEWNGTAWTLAATTGPSPRNETAMAYDSARGVVVLFGGGQNNNPQTNSDTWEWNGTVWTLRATTGPSARVRHAMAYDSARGKVVLFGGLDASGSGGSLVAKADTWEWNGTAWTLRATTGPAARTSHAMAYDRARGRTVLFGGFGNSVFGDTWEWNGTAWTLRANTGPTPRYDHALAYKTDCGRTVLFGGYDNTVGRKGDTWLWDGTLWKLAASTGPSIRNGQKLAYDSAHSSVVLFGGYSTAGVIGDTWLFSSAYYNFGPPYSIRCGRMDNFAAPNDPTTRSARLNSALPTVIWKNFDDPTVNRYVGHTFNNLPANIVKAQLIIRMKPLNDSPNNDSLHLGLLTASPPATWAWQVNIRNLPGAAGTWNFGVNPTTTFTLNLANLPGAVNIIPKLASERYLDLIVQDDTAVDWVQLCVWTCPVRPRLFGLSNSALGQAELGLNPDGSLLVSNIGSSGEDGVSVDLAQSEGFGWTITMPEPVPIGAMVITSSRGQVDGVPDQPAGTQGVERVAAGLRILPPDFTPSGASTYNVFLYREGVLVYSQLGMTGSPGTLINGSKPKRCCCPSKWTHWKWIIGKLNSSAEMQVTGGPTIVADEIVFDANGPTHELDFLSSVSAVAVGIPSFSVTEELIVMFGNGHQSIGAATLEPAGGFLGVANLGSSGQDGVSIDFEKVSSFSVGLEPIVDAEGNPLQVAGAYLDATAIGSLNGIPNQSLGFVRMTEVALGNYQIAADFSAIGSPTQHLQVVNQGALVADFQNHSGPVGSASTWMTTIGKFGGQTECIFERHPPGTFFTINGSSYGGDELRILAEGPTQAINYKSGLQLLTAGIPEITVVSAQTVLLPQVTAVVFRKMHGGAGPFDILLPPSGTPAVECRRDSSGPGNHTLVFAFNKNVVGGSASVTSGVGTISGVPSFAGTEMTVNITGASDVQTLTVTLSNILDVDGLVLPAASFSMGLLLGDINSSRLVNSTDIVQATALSGQPANAANFRRDINCSGLINSTDIVIVRSRSGSSLP